MSTLARSHAQPIARGLQVETYIVLRVLFDATSELQAVKPSDICHDRHPSKLDPPLLLLLMASMAKKRMVLIALLVRASATAGGAAMAWAVTRTALRATGRATTAERAGMNACLDTPFCAFMAVFMLAFGGG